MTETLVATGVFVASLRSQAARDYAGKPTGQ